MPCHPVQQDSSLSRLSSVNKKNAWLPTWFIFEALFWGLVWRWIIVKVACVTIPLSLSPFSKTLGIFWRMVASAFSFPRSWAATRSPVLLSFMFSVLFLVLLWRTHSKLCFRFSTKCHTVSAGTKQRRLPEVTTTKLNPTRNCEDPVCQTGLSLINFSYIFVLWRLDSKSVCE